jgi:beta-N-acetylhexosaminidase
MTGRLMKRLVALLTCLAVASCIFLKRKPSDFTPEPVTTRPRSLLAEMTLEEKAAQMVVAGLGGIYFPTREEEELVKSVAIGGVYRTTWGSLRHAIQYISELQQFARDSRLKVAPFVAGRYTCGIGQYLRYPTDVTPLPTQMAIGATGDPSNAYEAASIAAKEMRAAGITMNLAPNLEVSPEEGKFRFSTSRFGADPERVSRFGQESIKGLQANGILSVATGFPGVFEVPAGEREPAPVPAILKPIPVLSATDLRPFRDAVVAGADGIAVTATALPTVEASGLPAMLSPDVLTGLLRDMWGFQGLIVADGITGRVITANFEAHDAVVRAVNAGADLLVSVGGYRRHLTTIGHIIDAVGKNEIPPETVDAAVLRILSYKQKYGLLEPTLPDMQGATRICAQPASLSKSSDILKRGITVLKNDGNVLPLSRRKYESVFVTGVVGVERMAGLLEHRRMRVVHLESRIATYDNWAVPETDISRAERMAEDAELIVACTYFADTIPRGQESLVKRLVLLNKPVVVVALGSPFDTMFLQYAQACMVAYGPSAAPSYVAADMESVVDVMFGDCPAELRHPGTFRANAMETTRFDARELLRIPAGRLPVRLSPMYARGFAWADTDSAFLSGAAWDFGDGQQATGLALLHKYEVPGEYMVTINAANAVGNVYPLSFALTVADKDSM